MLTSVQQDQVPEQELNSKTLYEHLPSDDELDEEFRQVEEDLSEDENEEIPSEEVTGLAIETVEIVQLPNRSEYRDQFSQMELSTDEEDFDYQESSSDSDDEVLSDIEQEEVKDNILYSNLPLEKQSNLLKNSKVLRDGKEVEAEQVVDLSQRIHFLLSEQ
jgi:hypothetical protein